MLSPHGFIDSYVRAYNAYRTAEVQGVIVPARPGDPIPYSTPLRSVGSRIGIGTLGFKDLACGGSGSWQDWETQIAARNFDWINNTNIAWDTTQPTASGGTTSAQWYDSCIGAPQYGAYDFRAADHIRDFARMHGMRMTGNFLVYYATTPSWVGGLGPEAMLQAMRTHIRTVAGHFRGQMAVWHVVNEALTPDGPNPNAPLCSAPQQGRTCYVCLSSDPPEQCASADRLYLRSTAWSRKLGVRFIVEAFRAAREADPGAMLNYSDGGIEGDTGRFDELLKLLAYLRRQGVRVDGVGMQAHLSTTGGEGSAPTASHLAANMRQLGALGYKVFITELDVSMHSVPGDLALQRSIYHDVVQACVQTPACQAVLTFGIGDHDSWLQPKTWQSDPTCRMNPSAPQCTCNDRTAPAPLLFDCHYDPKPAYQGVLDALSGR
jgi:endo-1,4-beta-xylanase